MDMFGAWWISLLLVWPGAASSFMIYSSLHSLCLEDSASGVVQVKRCSLDSELQQWVWTVHGTLKCVGTSRCLSARQDAQQDIQTVSCDSDVEEPEDVAGGLVWDCQGDRLILRDSPEALELSTDGTRLSLSHRSKETRWRSVEEGDICKENLRSKRASKEPEEFEVKTPGEDQGQAAMTDEQREFLRWYYRTEDPTPWKFAMLGLSFACLLVGFLLLGMGSMANKNRKKIAKYKAAAALAQKPPRGGEELHPLAEVTAAGVTAEVADHKEVVAAVISNGAETTPQEDTTQVCCGHNNKVAHNGVNGSGVSGDTEVAFKPGDIVVTWKDGNVSNLYPVDDSDAAEEPPVEEERTEKVEEEEEGEVEEKVEEEKVGVEEKVEEAEKVEEEEEVEVELSPEPEDAQVAASSGSADSADVEALPGFSDGVQQP